MRRTLAEGRTVALSDGIVLLTGESGSGKDYLARFIHSRSKRSGGPFFAVNCAAVPAELAESELFGHEAGAFTGAGRRKRGLLELAEGGTLLLNEIGELSLNLQAKLLTFLDTRAFSRVGGISPVSVSARLIAATNRDLQTEVAQRRFRSDLFFRLNVFSITVPPLRERLEDLPLLVQELIAHLTADMQLPHAPEVDSGVLAALGSYPWPGNVRELRNVLERALMLSGGRRITMPALGLGRAESDWSCTVTFPEGRTLRDITGEITRSLVAEALRRCGGSKRAAARLLGISHDSLYRFMRMYEIAVGESDTVAYESSDSKTDRNMITS
jgi:transcriptional regulator with PAS, ATPase and Fis domain